MPDKSVSKNSKSVTKVMPTKGIVQASAKTSKTKQAQVDRLSGQNTVRVVMYERMVHPIYKKAFTITKRMLVDTAGHTVEVGDTVTITETKPISKRKSWIISAVNEAKK